MRKYITEKVGIVQLFQIIVTIVILSLEYYGFTSDLAWNSNVDSMGINVCVKINRKVNESALLDSECPRLDIHDLELCKPEIKRKYLEEGAPREVVTSAGVKIDISNFLESHMKRNAMSEIGFLFVVSLILLLLCSHLIISHVPKISNNIKLRTKWNAAMQGIILFASGFAAVLLSISANTIDTRYYTVSQQLQPCALLRYCDRSTKSHSEVNATYKVPINAALDEMEACQQIYIKRAVCILLIILIGMCMVMIMMALDITTKYEEDVDDEVAAEARELAEGLDTLIDDQVVFEGHELLPSEYIGDSSSRLSTASTYSMMLEPT